MLTLRCVCGRKQPRAFLPHLPIIISVNSNSTTVAAAFFFYSSTTARSSNVGYSPFFQFEPPSTAAAIGSEEDVVHSFREWFKSRNKPLLDRIFQILGSQNDHQEELSRQSADAALSQLGLCLSEALVLEVLNYGKDHVLSCLKFFDWSGRQPGFYHTRSTFYAIFNILSRAKLMPLMLDFLKNYTKHRYGHRVRFYNTLVMGYAIAGKPEVALQLFGRMRFQGIDLDGYTYHVLLNALVEENCFDVVEIVAKQIAVRGFENEVTHSILVKSFCKQKQLDKAEIFIRELVGSNRLLNGHVVGVLVDGLCKNNQFEKAARLVEEFRESGVVPMEHAYSVWINDLVRAGKLDGALEFLRSKKSLEGYVPDVFRYNTLICRLLRENRLEEVCDLLMEMKEKNKYPDQVTMNAALCFFCKAGMVDVALQLYNSRAEFSLSPSSMAYNYLINTLSGDGSIDEAYCVLKNSLDQGSFPGRKTFFILADALCREGKLDKLKELILLALERNFMPSDSIYDKFISVLCRARKLEHGYLLHGQLNRSGKVSSKYTYFNLISGFNKSNRGDIAARLLIEMQEKGHSPTRELFRAVICCLCTMENPEKQFLKLLEMQLSCHEPNCQIYNFFIDGAGHARKPELAREVFEMMWRSGILPNLSSDILMLQSYLKNERVFDALTFFDDLSQRRKLGRKLYNTMIVGLCKAKKPDIALGILMKMKETKLKPSLECYEELIKLLCSYQKYDFVVGLIEELMEVGRHVSSFIGNVLLLHSLKTNQLYGAWVHSKGWQNGTSFSSLLGELIGTFSHHIKVNQDIEELEKVIEQCFPLDIYTYNFLLRRLSINNMDSACELFNRLCKKGYEPNRWTYDILVRGFSNHGMTTEAKRWAEEMSKRGFHPTEHTKLFI
ncbi:pentatricopeptide repeat-containing protein At1g71210, mitochondrial-like [Cornus florida]|uniref:pentatricopeptide repeat-containing protein At1g71210, mitochondrial-like n=1 Tax=Cornus florida TaxID=4283 RepID=UPI0028A24A62|nr:pentatricopeptide repeat-containing protein At1g71210, mitochondrial-like [Cornus florida]XP_059624229.1 pentatricopeptide repeat-containing protein At1g71210, mitochondrial-like [Cornus florida]XP_059624230.1 pentatricopeptide repeat-containing protein At1g71210, mitochondrial-like [Cornus florida]